MSDEMKPLVSIDSPEFRQLLRNYAFAWSRDRDDTHSFFLSLIAHIDAWRVPSGYKLVPIEPTIAMHNAAALAGLCGKSPELEDGRIVWAPADASAVYLAMIAAVPKPEAPCGS